MTWVTPSKLLCMCPACRRDRDATAELVQQLQAEGFRGPRPSDAVVAGTRATVEGLRAFEPPPDRVEWWPLGWRGWAIAVIAACLYGALVYILWCLVSVIRLVDMPLWR